MDSNITINIVEPGSGPVVPNTGLFTSSIGGPEITTISISTVLILTMVAIIITALLYRKQKKSGKVTKLVHLVDSTKAVLKSKKRITAGLTAIALLASAGTLTTLLANAGKSNTNAVEEDGLTLDVTGGDITIEVGSEPVFAVLPVELTVKEATQAGYTLTAYTDNTDLVSTTDSSKVIPMVTLPEGSVETLESSESTETAGELSPLTDNTYGLALDEEPTTKDEAVYTSLSIDPEEPTILKSMPEYTPTEENDKTTIYYGFYITPDIPYGTYTGSDIYYNATINTTPVTFDGKGLYFNDDPEQTTNEVEYIAVPEEGKEYNINQIVSGEYKTPSQDLPYKFLGWSTDPEATVPTYETEEKIAEFLPISPNTPITLYAVWQKATTITYDSNGGAGEMNKQTIMAGESANLYPNTFTKDGFTFNGWNTRADGEGQEYLEGAEYIAQADYAGHVTLYAQWEEDILYMQDVATWGSTLAQGNEITVVDSRDGTEYTVARLADNNIWMTQNLDFDIVNGGAGLDSTNTDVPDNWNDAGKLANTYTTGTTTWNSSTTAPESYDPGELCWNGTPGSSTTEDCNENNSHYHLGNYYNWTAAVAMGDSSGYTTDGQDANQSICPAGWMLPKSGNQTDFGSFRYLVTRYGWTESTYTLDDAHKMWDSPLYSPLGGGWSGNLSDIGIYGVYWSSVVVDSGRACYLDFDNDGYVYPADNYNRSYGFTVRCVVR